jgi:hypothetical protein
MRKKIIYVEDIGAEKKTEIKTNCCQIGADKNHSRNHKKHE